MLRPILLAAALAPLAAAPAHAQSAETVSVAVPYGDLSLRDEADRAVLNRRVALAVKRVCGEADTRDLAMRQAVRDCRAAARAGGEARIAALTGGDRGTQLAAASPR